jgi:hypothetical protein
MTNTKATASLPSNTDEIVAMIRRVARISWNLSTENDSDFPPWPELLQRARKNCDLWIQLINNDPNGSFEMYGDDAEAARTVASIVDAVFCAPEADEGGA